jgi:hypothetical protein
MLFTAEDGFAAALVGFLISAAVEDDEGDECGGEDEATMRKERSILYLWRRHDLGVSK